MPTPEDYQTAIELLQARLSIGRVRRDFPQGVVDAYTQLINNPNITRSGRRGERALENSGLPTEVQSQIRNTDFRRVGGFSSSQQQQVAQRSNQIQSYNNLPAGAVGSGANGGVLFNDPSAPGGVREYFPSASAPGGRVIYTARDGSRQSGVLQSDTQTSSIFAPNQSRPQQATPGFFSRVGTTGNELGNTIFNKLGATKERTARFVGLLNRGGSNLGNTFGSNANLFSLTTQKSFQFAGGFVGGNILEFRDKPFTQLFSNPLLGAGIAGSIRVASFGIGKVGLAVAGLRGSTIALKTANYGALAAGIGFLGFEVAKQSISSIPALSKGDYTSPGQGFGRLFANIFSLGAGAPGGSKVGAKIVGRIRTKNLAEVPNEANIFDPLERQGKVRFPEIRRGETAGQLRQRFFETKLPGEKKGIARSFTASGIEFPKNNEISPGLKVKKRGINTIKSEFAGAYGADVVSPNFLRVSGESTPRLFSLSSFSGEPLIMRRELRGIDFAPGVSSTSSVGANRSRLRRLKLFFGGGKGIPFDEIQRMKPKGKLGFGYIPFVKSERELIIIKGTREKEVARRFFVKVDGIKVPISERTTFIDQPLFKGTKGKISRIKDFDIISSSSSSSRSSIFNPISLSFARSSKSKRSSPSSSFGSSLRSSSSSIPLLSSAPYRISSSKAFSFKPFSSSKRSRGSSSSFSFGGSSSSSFASSTGSSRSREPARIIKFRLRFGKRKKIQQRKSKFTDDIIYTPDFTSNLFKIRVKTSAKSLRSRSFKGFSGLGFRPIPIYT